MRAGVLLAVLVVLSCISICVPQSAEGLPDYKTRLVSSFETTANETTSYGNWSAWTWVNGPPASASVTRSSAAQYHGTYSARVNLSIPSSGLQAKAYFNFSSNASLGHYLFDRFTILFRLTGQFGSPPIPTTHLVWYYFDQFNGPVKVDSISGTLGNTTAWTGLQVTPVWLSNCTSFRLSFYMFGISVTGLLPSYQDLWLDFLTVDSSKVPVRIRYWNLYTGLGYYEEKLLARYYTLEQGWIDVWRSEFEAYKGDEILLAVTDIFNRNVWTGMVLVNSDPKYVDILAPIVTVHIAVPDWYNDSVPMEWRITCLPYGPDGLAGLELPTTGFEFEVLAGWYSISWLENHYAKAGNQTVFISGNVSERRSFMLTDLSIPINPDYELEVNGGDSFLDLKSWRGFLDSAWKYAAALYDDERVKAISLFLLFLSVLGLMYRAHQLKEIAERRGGRHDNRRA